MNKLILLLTTTLIVMTTMAQNPFLTPVKTVHGTFPFNSLKTEHFKPAFDEGLKQSNEEINKIVNNPQAPTFQNTIVALERSGELLGRVASVFFALNSANTNEEMQQLAQVFSAAFTEHSNSITLNAKLYERVKKVWDTQDKYKLTTEDKTLLKRTYEMFVNKGANLSPENQEVYRNLSKELSAASTKFSQNALRSTNAYYLNIKDKELLAGMSEDFLEMAKEKAAKKELEGWVIDITATSYVPFMKNATNRDLRRELWMAYHTQCLAGTEYDNTKNIKTIVNNRLEIAKLFGYPNFAEYALQNRMAEKSENVYKLLNDLLDAYKPAALKEVEEVQNYADNNGAYFKIQPWDWSFYSEKLKEEKYAISDDTLRPYFELENTKKGVFSLATQLFGITFTKNPKIEVYDPEVDAYEVRDAKGNFKAILYTDFHPRPGKRAGAWMTEYKGQYIDDKGKNHRPEVTIVMNFTRPTATKPALLTFEEFDVFLHEFGHALHGMLANNKYGSLAGTSVFRDFVELPSQLLENWGTEKEFLNQFAKHYETGEIIPDELIQKIIDASNYNAAYACLRQLNFGFVDMAFHSVDKKFNQNILTFEEKAMKNSQVLPTIHGTGRSTTFSHIFSGGYAAGYYSYKWAEVLDADAFEYFKENGIFNKKISSKFEKEVLSKGGADHPMTLYKNFRGAEPTIDPLLKRNGIKK